MFFKSKMYTFTTVSSIIKTTNKKQDTYQITVKKPESISNFNDMYVYSNYEPTHYDGCNYGYLGECITCLCHENEENIIQLNDENIGTIDKTNAGEYYYFTFITSDDLNYRIDVVSSSTVIDENDYTIRVYSDALYKNEVNVIEGGIRYYVKASFNNLSNVIISVVDENAM